VFLAHSFRLRDPWQFEAAAGGAARWSRVFHRPTGIEPDDELWLVCSGLPADSSAALNGTPLTAPNADRPHEFEVTRLLADANRIELHVPAEAASNTAGSSTRTRFPYDVRLAIVGHS
jgi:hypothetical protein